MKTADLTPPILFSIFSQHAAQINPFGAMVQCAHESGGSSGPFSSGLALNANNLAGIKAGNNAQNVYVGKTWEQLKDGSKITAELRFLAFGSVEDFVEHYVDMVNRLYPACATDNFLGYFAGMFKGKYGAWATDHNYFTRLVEIAGMYSPFFFDDAADKFRRVFVNAVDRDLLTEDQQTRFVTYVTGTKFQAIAQAQTADREEIAEAVTDSNIFPGIADFKRHEFACKCGKCGHDQIDLRIVEMCQSLRSAIGEPITVTSGCRCQARNTAVGSTSRNHVDCMAADLVCRSGSKKLFDTAKKLYDAGKLPALELCQRYVKQNFVHIDCHRPRNNRFQTSN